eukprot:CAMPEP_0197735470 /NCGR_PEP_ID=MMETSP1435-20131217/728_1 /TAXON_ID=426625 /ORGANISM="Chaetoceros brevis, Strain CCMP164" /LENGTH=77 /DNA_ID=CAMNT_0043323201 /DNA_START=144 /DNA_END=373 /DNA_ORIENTATION=-
MISNSGRTATRYRAAYFSILRCVGYQCITHSTTELKERRRARPKSPHVLQFERDLDFRHRHNIALQKYGLNAYGRVT